MMAFSIGPGRNRKRLWSARQVTSTRAPWSGMKRSRRLMPPNKRKITPQSFRGPEIKAFPRPSRESDGPCLGCLAADGLSEASFLSLLGEPDADLARRKGEPPSWLLELERAFSDPSPRAFPEPSLPERARHHAAFLEALRPLLDAGYSRLCQAVLDLSRRGTAKPPARSGAFHRRCRSSAGSARPVGLA
jgi:hypothetical protein